jgi:hypothetical protein
LNSCKLQLVDRLLLCRCQDATLPWSQNLIFASIRRDGAHITSDRSEETPPKEPIAAMIPEHVE